jgi:hypothetical protein
MRRKEEWKKKRKGWCWFILIGYILLTKTFPYQGDRIFRGLLEDLLQIINSRMEMAKQCNIYKEYH